MKNTYLIEGERTTIYVTRRNGDAFEVYIDTEDLARLKNCSIHVCIIDSINYAYLSCKGRHYAVHRYLMNTPGHLQTHHIDTNGLNNIKTNLENITQLENLNNRTAMSENSYSGIKNVNWKADKGKYQATIMIEGKQLNLGHFTYAIDAAQAVQTFLEK